MLSGELAGEVFPWARQGLARDRPSTELYLCDSLDPLMCVLERNPNLLLFRKTQTGIQLVTFALYAYIVNRLTNELCQYQTQFALFISS